MSDRETKASVTISVNGASTEVPAGTTVVELLERLGQNPKATAGIALAINDRVVRKADWPATTIAADDAVEIITATQGG